MLVVSFLLVGWLTVYISINVDSAEIKNKPLCLQRWELCMMEQTEPRRTAVECDMLMFEKHGCPKPKPWYRGRTADYDYVLTRDTVDTDKELDVQRGHKVKADQVKLEEAQAARERKVQDTYVPPPRNAYGAPEDQDPPPRKTYRAPEDQNPPPRNAYAPQQQSNNGPPRNAYPLQQQSNNGPPRNAYPLQQQSNNGPPRNAYPPQQQSNGPRLRRVYAPAPQDNAAPVAPIAPYGSALGKVPPRAVYAPAEDRRAYASAVSNGGGQRPSRTRNEEYVDEPDYGRGRKPAGVRRDDDFQNYDTDDNGSPRRRGQGEASNVRQRGLRRKNLRNPDVFQSLML